MGSIRKATPQALPFLRVTFKTSDVFSSWWWDLLFFPFSFARTRKLKSLECFHRASPRHRALFLQGHWEIDWQSLPTLMVLWFCFMEAVFPRERRGKAIHVQLSSTHPPTCGLSPAWASCCFGKNEGKNGVCAMRFRLCLLNPFPDWTLTTAFNGMGYCAHKIHSCAGGSNQKHWQFLGGLIPSGFPSPGAGCQLRSPGIFCITSFGCCLWWLLENATSESQGLTSVYCGK